MPSHIVVHWDGKVIKYENRKESDERLAIVLSSPQLDCHTQFLAAPRIPNGTGASMKDDLMTTLNVWDIPANNIIGMCWETMASNTGRCQGFATLFEKELGRGIMWPAYRHHIGELHIKRADVEVRGAWAGMGTTFSALFSSFSTILSFSYITNTVLIIRDFQVQQTDSLSSFVRGSLKYKLTHCSLNSGIGLKFLALTPFW